MDSLDNDLEVRLIICVVPNEERLLNLKVAAAVAIFQIRPFLSMWAVAGLGLLSYPISKDSYTGFAIKRVNFVS